MQHNHNHHASSSSSCTPSFHAAALVSETLPSSHMLVRSAAYFGYDLHLLVLSDHSKENFVSTRWRAALDFLRSRCDKSVVMLLDAYDVFLLMPAAVALARFHAANARVVWSVERFFSGQDELDKPFFEEMRWRNDSEGVPIGVPYGFINTGGFIGIASTLSHLVEEALTITPGASGWHNKTCGEPHGRHCSDQWIFGHLLKNTWNRFNTSLDYKRNIFYVATSHDWSYHYASKRIAESTPCVVHVPFTQAPRVNATLHALYESHFLKQPPPEATLETCQARSAECRDLGAGLNDLHSTLDRTLTEPRPRDALRDLLKKPINQRPKRTVELQPALRLQAALHTPRSSSSSNAASAATTDKPIGLVGLAGGGDGATTTSKPSPHDAEMARLVEAAACTGYGADHPEAMRKGSDMVHCMQARSKLNASTWAEVGRRMMALADLWRASVNGSHPVPGSIKQRMGQIRQVTNVAVFGSRPYCYRAPSGIYATWISC